MLRAAFILVGETRSVADGRNRMSSGRTQLSLQITGVSGGISTRCVSVMSTDQIERKSELCCPSTHARFLGKRSLREIGVKVRNVHDVLRCEVCLT